MDHRVEVCQEWLTPFAEHPDYLSSVIIYSYNESWVHYCDLNTKQESSTWKTTASPQMRKVCQQKSANKLMLVAFFHVRGVVY